MSQRNIDMFFELFIRIIITILLKGLFCSLINELIFSATPLCEAGMDSYQIRVNWTNNQPKIIPLYEGWHRFLQNLGILLKKLHEGLV